VKAGGANNWEIRGADWELIKSHPGGTLRIFFNGGTGFTQTQGTLQDSGTNLRIGPATGGTSNNWYMDYDIARVLQFSIGFRSEYLDINYWGMNAGIGNNSVTGAQIIPGASGKFQIPSATVFPMIRAPVAGNFPQGLYKFPYSGLGRTTRELYLVTLNWEPAVPRTFNTNTVYTAVVTLEPRDDLSSLSEMTIANVSGLPSGSGINITSAANGDNYVVRITFPITGAANAAPQLLFQDEFNGTSLDTTKWRVAPEWNRQGRSYWRNDMVSVSGGSLRIGMKREDPGPAQDRTQADRDNWIRTGGVRTATQTQPGTVIFENTFGYYEARIRYPPISGTWGAFWLMGQTVYDRLPGASNDPTGGIDGTEIDIVEFFHNTRPHQAPGVNGTFNNALHWDGYDQHKGSASYGSTAGQGGVPNIYTSGQFHVYALCWSPTEYVFYVDGVETWRYSANGNICRNPLYLKLSIEGADWASPWEGSGHIGLPPGFTSAEMEVDYVRVWNQPRDQIPGAGTGNQLP
jgi:beta-glucanase (GH16 family)